MRISRLATHVIVPLLLLFTTLAQALYCPSVGSRQARAIVDAAFAQLQTPVDRGGLPGSCIFRKDNDVQAGAELLLQASREANERSGSNTWRCPLCRPVDAGVSAEKVQTRRRSQEDLAEIRNSLPTGGFWSEPLLERHLWQKHLAQVERSSPSQVCLADYCDILRCPGFLKPSPAGLNDDVGHYTSSLVDVCRDPKAAAVRTSFCYQLLSQCFPPEDSPQSYDRYKQFTARFCTPFQCAALSSASPSDHPPSGPPDSSSSSWPRLSFYLFFLVAFLIYFGYWYRTRRAIRSSDFRQAARSSAWKDYK